MDVSRLAKQLGVDNAAVIAKAKELVQLASVRMSGGLGNGEICKAAVCLELASLTGPSSKELTRERFVKSSCVSAKVYTSTFNLLQGALGVSRKVDLQQLVMQFGCASVRQSVLRVLQLYKERFVAKLPEGSKAAANFERPVFLAVAFSLVARKNKIKVDQKALLDLMGVPRDDFLNISASMYALCFDVVGVEKTKKRATTRKTNTAVLENHRQELSGSESEEAGPSGRDPADPARAPKASAKRAKRQGDYDEWKLLVLAGKQGGAAKGAAAGPGDEGPARSKRKRASEAAGDDDIEGPKLKQLKLAFAPPRG